MFFGVHVCAYAANYISEPVYLSQSDTYDN